MTHRIALAEPAPVPADLSTPVSSLGIMTRTHRALARQGVATLGDIVSMTAAECGRLEEIGAGGVDSIQRALLARGLQFARDEEDFRLRCEEEGVAAADGAAAERAAIVFYIEARAAKVERHGGKASARQLRVVAGDVAAGMHEEEGR